jgi:hypothetical protein
VQLDNRDRCLPTGALPLAAEDLDLRPTEAVDGLLLVADATPAQGATHLPFKLSAAGEELLLFIGEAIVDEVTVGDAVTFKKS